jgi:hypothetical protein
MNPKKAVLMPGRKLIVELHVEFEENDRPRKLVIAETQDEKLWLNVLNEIIEKESTP